MYNSVSREQIADTLIHLRGLFREIPTSSEKDDLAHERLECPAPFVPVEMRQTGLMKGLENLYQLEG